MANVKDLVAQTRQSLQMTVMMTWMIDFMNLIDTVLHNIILEVYGWFLHYIYGITKNKFPLCFLLKISHFPLDGFLICYTREGPLNLIEVRKIMLQFVEGPPTI